MNFQFIFVIVFLVILFAALRELFTWYWKINEIRDNQKEIIRILEQIRKAMNQQS